MSCNNPSHSFNSFQLFAHQPSVMTWLTWAWAAGSAAQHSRLQAAVETSIKLLYRWLWRSHRSIIKWIRRSSEEQSPPESYAYMSTEKVFLFLGSNKFRKQYEPTAWHTIGYPVNVMPPANTADVIAMWKHVFRRVCQLFLVILIELITENKTVEILSSTSHVWMCHKVIPVMQYIGDDNGKETEKQHCSTGVDHRVENFH